MMTSEHSSPAPHSLATQEDSADGGVVVWLKKLIHKKPHTEEHLREVLEDYIEEMSGSGEAVESAVQHELTLLTNILELRDMTADDLMIPRVDIVAIDIDTSQEELLNVLAATQHHRIPVYREELDDMIGVIHIKDVLKCLARNEPIILKNLVKDAPVISPAMPVFDLLLMMREQGRHMVFVVDEFGGIDGLVTIGDIIGTIVGEVRDKLDKSVIGEITEQADGTAIADARTDITVFEETFGKILNEDERENADTLGGFIFLIAGRVPARGEIITHAPSRLVFEILEADPRRVLKVSVRRPAPTELPAEA